MTAIQERFNIDPVFRQQTLSSRQCLYQLAQDIAAGATTGSTGISQEQFITISDEIVRMVVTLLLDAFDPLVEMLVVVVLMRKGMTILSGDADRGGADARRGTAMIFRHWTVDPCLMMGMMVVVRS